MSTSAAVIILAILLVMATLIVIESRARRPKTADNPDCTAEEAWSLYLAKGAEYSERDARGIASITTRPEAAEELQRKLRRTIDAVLATDTPMITLRQEIMEASDSFLMMESMTIPGDQQARASVAALDAIVEAGVLRTFGQLRFADLGKDDWYTHYLHVAEMNARNVATMVRKTLGGQLDSIETSLHEPLTHAMRDAREALLHLPVQTAVDRSTKLSHGQLPQHRSPSQQQIDELTNVMSDRFDKLFGGQLYRQEGGQSLSPAAALQIDASLLYCAIAKVFRQPDSAWREILDESLPGHAEALLSDEDLPNLARSVYQTWRENAGDAPLRQALAVACAGAGVDLEGNRPSAEMSHDASLLVGDVQRVLGVKA